jgi:hypothetical protein
VTHGNVSVAGVGIDPGRDEDLAPGVEFRAGNRLFGFEVEQVVLVNRRRDDEDRGRVDLIGAGLVLDELVDPGLAHDLSCGGGEVVPEFEGRLVDTGGQLGRRAQVGEQIAEADAQALAPGVDGLLPALRVREQAVRGRERRHDGVEGEQLGVTAGDVEQRHRDQRPQAGADIGRKAETGKHVLGVGQKRLVGRRHALGIAGGAGRVEEGRDVAEAKSVDDQRVPVRQGTVCGEVHRDPRRPAARTRPRAGTSAC